MSSLQAAARQRGATVLLVVSGLATALAAASCCALPPLLIWAGVAGLWTLELQSFFGPHLQTLIWLADGTLAAGAGSWAWQMRKVCAVGLSRRNAGWHLLMLLGLAAGGLLSWMAVNPV